MPGPRSLPPVCANIPVTISTANDRVVHAIDRSQVHVAAEGLRIAGVEPTVSKGDVGKSEVAAHDGVPTHNTTQTINSPRRVRHRTECGGVPSSAESESDVAIAARVSVEVRFRAVTEVADGAPVTEVANRWQSRDRPSQQGASAMAHRVWEFYRIDRACQDVCVRT